MIRRTVLIAAAMTLVAGAASAQQPRVELGATAGWTFSDGVGGANAVIVPGVGTFDRIDPKDAFSWGARLGFMVTDNVEIGALYSLQSTSLEIGGTTTVKLGDESLHNYHGYFAYNFGDPDSKARPYFLGGAGATQFGGVKIAAGNAEHQIGGNTRFSTTWALGLKVNASRNIGIRLEGRWTPTYVKSDAAGWWCDPYWGCYVTEDPQYANQFEVGGGITLRF